MDKIETDCIWVILKKKKNRHDVFQVYGRSLLLRRRENEEIERESPGPALGICHVHESYF